MLLTLLNIVYLFFLITFLIYWLFKFLIFLYKLDIEVVQPNKLKYKLSTKISNRVIFLVFIYCICRPYLVSYSIIYKILKFIINYKKTKTKINFNTVPLLTILLTLVLSLSYLIGLPIRVVRDSFKWGYKWLYSMVLNCSWDEKLLSRISDIALLVFDEVSKIESYRVFRDKDSGDTIQFNPVKKPNLYHDTTLIPIIKEYIPFFKQIVNYRSFKHIGKNNKKGCFRQYHSGSIIELACGKFIVTNFLTHKPQGNFSNFVSYDYNDRTSYDLSANLVLCSNWKNSNPVIKDYDDFRNIYFTNQFFIKNSILSLTLNSNFSKFDAKSPTCTTASTDRLLSEDDLIYKFYSDIFRDKANTDYISAIDGNEVTIFNKFLTFEIGLGSIYKIPVKEIINPEPMVEFNDFTL